MSAPIGATILGWIAVSQIHRSAGKIHGLWLAVFDGLLFPLLALDALVLVPIGFQLSRILANPHPQIINAMPTIHIKRVANGIVGIGIWGCGLARIRDN